jgi:hypothetical protein
MGKYPSAINEHGRPCFDQFCLATSKRGSAQANWVALTNTGRCNNSSGDDFACYRIVAGLGK